MRISDWSSDVCSSDLHIAERGVNAETIPYTVEQIRDLFLQKLVIDYDYVFCMTITRTRSPIFDNAQKASYAILNEYSAIRSEASNTTTFALLDRKRVV